MRRSLTIILFACCTVRAAELKAQDEVVRSVGRIATDVLTISTVATNQGSVRLLVAAQDGQHVAAQWFVDDLHLWLDAAMGVMQARMKRPAANERVQLDGANDNVLMKRVITADGDTYLFSIAAGDSTKQVTIRSNLTTSQMSAIVALLGKAADTASAIGANQIASIRAHRKSVVQKGAGRSEPYLIDSPHPGGTRDLPYFEYQVDKQATQVPGTGRPKYPAVMRDSKINGRVLAQFIVGIDGRCEPGSFKVILSTHELFTQAAVEALADMRFTPAQLAGKPVRQIVQQPFIFSLSP